MPGEWTVILNDLLWFITWLTHSGSSYNYAQEWPQFEPDFPPCLRIISFSGRHSSSDSKHSNLTKCTTCDTNCNFHEWGKLVVIHLGFIPMDDVTFLVLNYYFSTRSDLIWNTVVVVVVVIVIVVVVVVVVGWTKKDHSQNFGTWTLRIKTKPLSSNFSYY